MFESRRPTSEAARGRRVPLYVPVSVGERLYDCFSINIGPNGIALSASLCDGPAPEARDILPTSLTLPSLPSMELTSPLCVEWVRKRAAQADAPPTVIFGGSFRELDPAVRTELERYVAEYRPRVAFVGGQAGEVARVAAQLTGFEVTLTKTAESFCALQPQPPFSAIVIAGEDDALGTLESLCGAHLNEEASLNALSYATLAPRIVFWGHARADRLLAFHNAAKLFRSVVGEDTAGLQAAVRAATEDFEARSELQQIEARRPETPSPRPESRSPALDSLVYIAASMRKVVELVQHAARFPVGVLLRGETGAGKEILARALHELSPRARAPFVAQDCAALSDTLLESELFGHVRGAFTGATTNYPGLFAIADGGTLFLDEVENTTPAFQAKLLRVLESGEVRPVGATASRRLDVRIIAATNRDLLAAVRGGSFRSDLYYRLERFVIEVPPLRERREDILPIARELVARFSAQLAIRPPAFDEQLEQALVAYDWPGNVRELRNLIERQLIASAGAPRLGVDSLPAHLRESSLRAAGSDGRSLRARMAEYERTLIAQALADTNGVARAAARILGLDPVTLMRRARRLGVWPPNK